MKQFYFIIVFMFIYLPYFCGCNKYYTLSEWKCYHIEYCYPDNKKSVISKKNRHLVFAQSKDYLLMEHPGLYHKNDSLWSYIFINDLKDNIDSLWFKPDKVYLTRWKNDEVLAYKYKKWGSEFAEVFIKNGVVIDMRFFLFNDGP